MPPPRRCWPATCQAFRHAAAKTFDGVKVLLNDNDAERAGALAETLARDPALQVRRIPHDASLPEAVTEHAPDVVIVDMARPDRDALEGVRQVTAAEPRPIVLFVDQADPAFMENAIDAGVSSYNVLGTPPPDVKPILRVSPLQPARHLHLGAARYHLFQARLMACPMLLGPHPSFLPRQGEASSILNEGPYEDQGVEAHSSRLCKAAVPTDWQSRDPLSCGAPKGLTCHTPWGSDCLPE